jgi:PAS domain S-box-containing protein
MRLALLATALIISVLSAGGALVLHGAAAERAAVEKNAMTLARFTALSIDREIAAARSLLATLAASPALDAVDLAGFHALASSVERPPGSFVVLYDAAGPQLLNTSVPYGSPLPEPSAARLAWNREILAARGPIATDLIWSPLRGEYVVGVGLPIEQASVARFILAISIPVDVLTRILDEHEHPATWSAGILDRRGNTIARAQLGGQRAAHSGRADLLARFGADQSGMIEDRSGEGVPVRTAFARSAVSGWTAVIDIPLAELAAPLRKSLVLLLAGGGLLLLGGVAIAVLVGRGISRPVERQLRDSEERFRAMAETVPAMLFMAGPDGSTDYANQRFIEVTGFDREGPVGFGWSEFLHPAEVEDVMTAWQRSIDTGEPYAGEFRLRGRDGAYRWHAGRARAIRAPSGEVLRWVGAAIDVDDLKRTEQALRELGDKRGAILASISETYFTLDRERRVTEINAHFAEWARRLGADASRLIGRRLSEVFPAMRGSFAEAELDRALEAQGPSEFDAPSAVAPGLWIEVRVYPAYEGHSVFIRDITDRKATEVSLRMAQESLQSTMDALSARLAILDAQGRIVAVNAAWRRFARESGLRAPDDGLGSHYLALAESGWPGIPDAVRSATALGAVMRDEKETYRTEYSCPGPGGALWFQLRVSRFDSGQGLRVVLAHEDITEIQRSATTLQKVSERLLRSQEEERRRIARDLHDSTAQNLAAAAMFADRLGGSVRRLGKEAEALTVEIGTLVRQALQEIRNFSYLLHPPQLGEGGLAAALRSYVGGLATRSGLAIEADIPRNLPPLPHDLETTLFRIAQESFANILRHSGATRVVVRLRIQSGSVVLEISDDGKGMSSARSAGTGSDVESLGVGIPGMRARLRQLGGSLDIASSRRGTTVRAAVPLNDGGQAPSVEEDGAATDARSAGASARARERRRIG